ncbi:MAG: peptidoglycan bridge formation glycyltransferase FemA/FemB family protein [Chloroflexota bacterium]|nr:peptidoglycan bridge formation glycyltransferase FemA/FemB family protein [Chloroflexota bacterium]
MSERAPVAPAAAGRSGMGTDPAAWDRFVAEAPNGAYTQLSAWSEVKRANGWQAWYPLEHGPGGPIGAQVLVRRLGPLPWLVAYAPRGPVASSFRRDAVGAWTNRLRRDARANPQGGISHVTIDPEVEEGHPLAGWLQEAGWRRAPAIQPDRTRLVDLTLPEPALWSGLRSKWRQYVQKARRDGAMVTEVGEEGIEDFYRIYVETARRARFVYRAESAYRDVYRAYAAKGAVRLLFARLGDGSPVATVMLLSCGRRVTEPYGGMTDRGGESRANYLLKWEAIRSSREAGFAVYDMWGMAHAGIDQFKAGFGGREVRYVGAWELVLNAPVRRALAAAQHARVSLARRRLGLTGGGASPGGEGG